MSSGTRTRVAILQGNRTVARLMREFLEEQAFEVELLQGAPPGAPRAHLVIVDVDSGVESAERWLRHCESRQLPVLLCGVPNSRQELAHYPWLDRPFAAQGLLRRCQEVLGQTLEVELEGGEDEPPPAIHVGISSREKPTLELPTASALEALDEEHWEEPEQVSGEWLDILELDGSSSMILEIEDLSGLMTQGGMLVGQGSRRRVEADELATAHLELGLEDSVSAADETREDLDQRRALEGGPGYGEATGMGEATVVSTWEDVVAGEFSSVHRIATLLAEHWDRLGLTARPADRADRLQRVLTAMWRGGLESFIDELRRIPAVHGFSGSLETLPLEALLSTISDRGLRGRLEIGMGGDSFVLYLDRDILDEVDSLGENTEGLLLRSLRSMGALDEDAYRYYRRRQRDQSGESVEMALRAEGVVEERQLWAAKQARAYRLIEKMRQGRAGTFAFIQVPRDSGQSWPTQSLGLGIRELLDSSGGARPNKDNLQTDEWAVEAVTEPERRAMEYQSRGDEIGEMRVSAVEEDDEEPIEDVVARVKRLELLRRLGHGEEAALEEEWPPRSARPLSRRAGPDDETHQEMGFEVGVPDELKGWEDSRRPLLKESPGPRWRGEEDD